MASSGKITTHVHPDIDNALEEAIKYESFDTIKALLDSLII